MNFLAFNIKRVVDPTKSRTLRNRFSADMYKRFRKLKGKVNHLIVHEDAFGLTRHQRFDFPRADQKVAAFMQWLRRQAREGILEIQEGVPIEAAAKQAWTKTYIQSAYQKGIAGAGQKLRGQGVDVHDTFIDSAFNRPIHADRAGLLYTRTFTELQGVTDAMSTQMSQTLTQGLIEGRGPKQIASQLNKRVDKIGISRARRIARTEVIAAHAEATVNTYEEAGAQGVEVFAELNTTGDDLVCQECLALEQQTQSKPLPINEAHGIVPVHPNCRCALIPVLPEDSPRELR